MIYNWSQIYSTQLKTGEDYTLLKPTTSIWILENTLFSPKKDTFDSDFDKYMHLNFQLYDSHVNLQLSNHLNIHILQLPFLKADRKIQNDKERWVYFFKQGQDLDPDQLPEALNTKEIRKAMKTLKYFSDDQKAYLIYQSRLDFIRTESTWQSIIKQKNAQLQEKDAQLQEKDAELLHVTQEKDAQIKHLMSLLNQDEKKKL
ncbi:hypothetical protein GMMP1_1090016 [Candidatus Magnetomoraceae bacterium gMMP-1]